MFDPYVVLHARERWRVVRSEDPDESAGYVVIDTAGIELRREASLEDARAWIDRRIAEEHAPSRVPVRKPIR